MFSSPCVTLICMTGSQVLDQRSGILYLSQSCAPRHRYRVFPVTPTRRRHFTNGPNQIKIESLQKAGNLTYVHRKAVPRGEAKLL